MVKGIPIKREEHGVRLGCYRGRSRRVIEQSQFPETLPRLVHLQVFRLLILAESFKAVQLALVHHVEHVAVLPLGDYVLASREGLLLHGVYHHLLLAIIQALEHKSLWQTRVYSQLRVLAFFNYFRHEFFLFVENSERLSTKKLVNKFKYLMEVRWFYFCWGAFAKGAMNSSS